MSYLLSVFLIWGSVSAEQLGRADKVTEIVNPGPEPFEKNCPRKWKKGKYNTGDVGKFLRTCLEKGVLSNYCMDMSRPNRDPLSRRTFRCTYPGKPHALVPPNETEWQAGIEGALTLQRIAREGRICVKEIYNWYRPEPYNRNVGGKPGRHPRATSIDVRFCTPNDTRKAHRSLCALYKKKAIWALGSYPSGTSLHIGVRPELHTTWGGPFICR